MLLILMPISILNVVQAPKRNAIPTTFFQVFLDYFQLAKNGNSWEPSTKRPFLLDRVRK